MAILDKAKFLLIPSGYKYAKVYSIFPSSGAFDFTFARTGDDATRQNVNSLIETKEANLPRLNHHNNGCPSLLLEGTITNRLRQSEDFSGSVYTPVNLTVTTNQIISPSGDLNADKLTRTSTAANYIHNVATKSSAATMNVTLSVFVKQGQGDYFAMRMQGLYPQRGEAIYQFSTNTLTLTTPTTTPTNVFSVINSKVENYGNGWNRLSATFNIDANNTVSGLFSPRSTNGTIDSNDASSTAFAYIWGCQIEEAVGASSYIKTENLPTSRNFDDCFNTLAFTLGADATFYFDFEVTNYDQSFRSPFIVRNVSFSRYISFITYEDSGIYYLRIRGTSNGGTQNLLIDYGQRFILFFQRNKVALRLYGNNYEIYVNGSQVKTGTVTGDFDVLNGETLVSDFGSSSNNASRKIFTHAIFDETLTTSDLRTLTTI